MDSISMWDVKDMFNKVKNVVMNYTEMEIKVNEATNGDAWGASSTLMKEIAQATYSFQNFNEIMPCIYKRFSECEAHQWRQIYKALTLLEYLLKNGSDRVVDDVKAHITTIKMLRSFHHIDDQGKDQGINVRQRAKELVELIQSSARIREERAKAKANRNKYTGVSSSSGGYGGFGSSNSDNFGRSSSRYQDDDSNTSEYSRSQSSSRSYRDSPTSSNATTTSSSRMNTTRSTPRAPRAPSPPPASSEPTPSLLDLDDFNAMPTPTPAVQPAMSLMDAGNSSLMDSVATSGGAQDDDWGDFQSTGALSNTITTPAPPSALAPQSASADLLANDFDFLSVGGNAGANNVPMSHQPQSFASTPLAAPQSSRSPGLSSLTTPSTASPANAASPKPGNDIWSQNASLVSLDLLGSRTSGKPAKAPAKPSMNSLASMQAMNKLSQSTASPMADWGSNFNSANASRTSPAMGSSLAGSSASLGSGRPAATANQAITPISKSDLDLFL